MRRALPGVIVALVVLSAVELTCQLFFRVLGDRFVFAEPNLYTVPPERIESMRSAFDAELGWCPRFDTPHGERPRDAVYGDDYMATFGDSHVFCDEVDAGETWQGYLAQALGADVYNFGVSGYGPDQALLRMRRVTANLKPRVVCLHIGPENINRIVNRYRPFYFPRTGLAYPKPRFVLVGNTLQLIPNPLQDASQLDRLSDPKLIHSLGAHDDWYSRRDLPRRDFPYARLLVDPRIWRQAWSGRQRRTDSNPMPQANLWRQRADARRLYFAIMDAFAADAGAIGSRPLFVLLPGTAVVTAVREGRGIPGHKRLLERCRQSGYDCFDGITWVARAIGDEPLERYFQPGGHVSPRGNALTAEGLRRFLEARGMSPAALVEPDDPKPR